MSATGRVVYRGMSEPQLKAETPTGQGGHRRSGRVEGDPLAGGRDLCRPGPFRALARMRVENRLAQPDRLRRHLDELVFLNIGERLLERLADRRRQDPLLILARRADVGELAALEDVDFEVVAARVLADDHALIDLDAG